MGIWVPAHWGLGEIDGLLVPPGKAFKLLTDNLITGLSLPRKCVLVKPSTHISLIGLLGRLYTIVYEAHFQCHNILMLGKVS